METRDPLTSLSNNSKHRSYMSNQRIWARRTKNSPSVTAETIFIRRVSRRSYGTEFQMCLIAGWSGPLSGNWWSTANSGHCCWNYTTVFFNQSRSRNMSRRNYIQNIKSNSLDPISVWDSTQHMITPNLSRMAAWSVALSFKLWCSTSSSRVIVVFKRALWSS